MHELRMAGTYYEMGHAAGEALRRDRGLLPRFSRAALAKGRAYERAVRDHAPDLLEELRGISDGSGVPYEALVAYELSPYRLQPACLVMAVSGAHTRDAVPIFAHNQEWTEEAAADLTVCRTEPRGRLRSLGFTYHTMDVSRFGGTNEAGLAIASATTTFDNPGPGVMFNIATRWVLDNCRNVDDAVEFLQGIPSVWGTAYLIMDTGGSIAKVEAHARTTVTRVAGGFGFVTLRFDSPDMEAFNETEGERAQWVAESYAARKAFLTEWFGRSRGRIDGDMVIGVLRDHERKMCTHAFDGELHYGISWSWLLTLGGLGATVCEGPPCRNEFRRV